MSETIAFPFGGARSYMTIRRPLTLSVFWM